ncbi:MAG: transporter [Verrucomicrobia bacterium]|nr:MAG: transporter [Verrucomicrobiota bacterium]
MNADNVKRLCAIPAAALFGMLLLSSCTTVGPDFEEPEAPVAEDWLESDDARVNTSTTTYRDWWDVFHDPVLSKLIETAYQQNLTLQIAGLRIMEARAQLGFATGLQYPQSQSVNASYVVSKSSRNAPPLANLPDDIRESASQSVDFWGVSFDAAWEADVWGKFQRGMEAADANLAARTLDYDSVLVMLSGDVAALYTTIRTFGERLSYARENVGLQQESLDLAETRYQLGATSELDVEQAKALLYNTEALIPILELGLSRTKNVLSQLLGLPPSDLEYLLGGTGGIPAAPPTVAVGIPADLIRRRPDVRAAEMAAAAQSAAIGINQADLYPHFGLAGSIGLAGDTFADQFASGSGTGFFTPFVKWDIFNYGRIRNNVRIQDARFEQLVVAYQNTALAAAREVQDGLQGFLRTREQVGFLTEAVGASDRAAQLALVQYQQGATDYTRVLNTQTSLLQQQDALTEARGQVVSNLVATYKALGGGWQIREGHDFIKSTTAESMAARTNWGEMLAAPSETPEAPPEP